MPCRTCAVENKKAGNVDRVDCADRANGVKSVDWVKKKDFEEGAGA
ncbi:MAG: hypothetical protein IJ991_10820 [Thermoguttaceae bacterium]|nr:hypothetical protein [Thermoguttaceae bacterium]